jgi:hypothetical protein
VLQSEHEKRRTLTREHVERGRRVVQLRYDLDPQLAEDAFDRVEPDRLLVKKNCASRLPQNRPFPVKTLEDGM